MKIEPTPPVQHPDDPARWGVLVPWGAYVEAGDSGGIGDGESFTDYVGRRWFIAAGQGRHRFLDEADWRPSRPSPWFDAYLRSHEFDPTRGFEAVVIPDGVAVFYLPAAP